MIQLISCHLHLPKYGILRSLAYWAAKIFPSIPLEPNPPGTIIPLLQDELSSLEDI